MPDETKALSNCEEEMEKLESEFRDTELRLHAAAAENQVLRGSLHAVLQNKRGLELIIFELERQRDASAKDLEEVRRSNEELSQRLRNSRYC